MRVVYFTAGTTGAGHVVRGIAIGRALNRAGFRGTYAMVGPRSLRVLAPRDYYGVTIDHDELVDPERASSSELARTLDLLAPDLLVVDMFWAPLVRLLPRAACEAWLLVRRAPPAWLVGRARMPFERAAYARVIAIEPGVDAGEAIDPIVAVDRLEVLPARALRDRLGVADAAKLDVVVQAGAPDEWRALVQDARGAVHVFTLGGARYDDVPANVRVHDDLFPLAPWLAGADAITSGAGYNSFWEARWLGHAVRTRFIAFARPIDDQAWRIRTHGDHTPRANGADTLAVNIVGARAASELSSRS